MSRRDLRLLICTLEMSDWENGRKLPRQNPMSLLRFMVYRYSLAKCFAGVVSWITLESKLVGLQIMF